MNVLDKLGAYKKDEEELKSEVFDVRTKAGRFLAQIHKEGYLMYQSNYKKGSENLTKVEYERLSEPEKTGYVEEVAYTELYNLLTTSGDQLVMANAGSGKALTNNTLIRTPEGYKELEELREGDKVQGLNEKEIEIQGVYPQGKKQVYEVTVRDESGKKEKVSCSGDHLWSRNEKAEEGKGYKTLSTKDIKKLLDQGERYELPRGKVKKVEKRWVIDEITETERQEEMTCIEVKSEDKQYLIQGGVPTHNTTALIFKIMYDMVTGETLKEVETKTGLKVQVPDTIFVGTFLKTGADELGERLLSWQRKMGYEELSGTVTFSTLHAEFKRCLNGMGVVTTIGDMKELDTMFRRALRTEKVKRKDNERLTLADYQTLSAIYMYYRGRLDDKRASLPSMRDYNLSLSKLNEIHAEYTKQKTAAGVMDFEDMQELLYKYLYTSPNKAVQDYCASRYKYFYLDEFQDTSQLQYAILKAYSKGRLAMNKAKEEPSKRSELYTGEETKGKFLVVGDSDQCIYEWRGSDNSIIRKEYAKDYNPQITSLSYNYRCPLNVLEAIIPSIKKNEGNSERQYKAAKNGGESNAYTFESYGEMLRQLDADISEAETKGQSTAILCRTNYDGSIPAFYLESRNKYRYKLGSRQMTLDGGLAKKILGVTSLFTEKASDSVSDTVGMLISYEEKRSVLKGFMERLANSNKNIWLMDMQDYDYSFPSISEELKEWRDIFYQNGERDRFKEIEALKKIYVYLYSNGFKGTGGYAESARSYIESLLTILEEEQFATVLDFVDYVNTLNLRMYGRVTSEDTSIQISTVHDFKGKEADVVIVWNDSADVFPSKKTDMSNNEELEAERRLHYVACTRAKYKSNTYSLSGNVGMFVSEMGIMPKRATKPQGGRVNESI